VIHFIDRANGIAVFESINDVGASGYVLMITENTIRRLPIIVNYCETAKQLEFKFETPNYDKLLKIN
jgi:hypothetical protein